jgi:GDPmannose 4,6-dehydratase
VRRIKRGETQELRLGNLDIWRDWGWAAEYVVAMHQMLQAPIAKDYLIASGHTTSLREFVRLAFAAAGLEADRYLVSDATFLRPSDLKYSSMDPSLIFTDLGWKAQAQPSEIVQRMYEERLI